MAHITVTPADDDEIIVAGREDAPEPERAPDTATAPIRPDKAPTPNSVPSRSRPDFQHETTLADLEPSKMPAMQRAIIVAAIVCIIGALVYCLVMMR